MDNSTAQMILSALSRHGSADSAALFALLAAGCAGLAAAAVGPLAARIMPKPRETWLADANPFEAVLNDETTLLCKDGALATVVTVHGVDLSTIDYTKRQEFTDARKRWIDMLAGRPATVRVLSTRRRRPIETGGLGAAQPGSTLGKVIEAWNSPFAESFDNAHSILICVPAGVERAKEQMAEILDLTIETLREFKPVPLRLRAEADDGGGQLPSPLLTYLNELWNPCASHGPGGAGLRPEPVGVSRRNGAALAPRRLSRRMRADALEVESRTGLLKFSDGGRVRYAQCVAVSEFGDQSSDQLAADVMAVDAELVLLHHIRVMDRATAEMFVDQRSRMALAGRGGMGAEESKAQFLCATALLSPDAAAAQTLVEHQMTVFAFGDSPEQARQAQAAVRGVFRDWNVNPITDTHVASIQWFTQFPTYEDPIRPNALMSKNVAEFCNFENVSTGSPHCMWGEFPTLIFPSATRVPYRFIFHESANRTGEPLGHTIAIGRTGSGKSTVMSMIVAGALRYPKLRVFMLDRFRGLYVFTKAMGGEYISIDSKLAGEGMKTGRLQPLQVAETSENRAHLRNWFRILAGVESMSFGAGEDAEGKAQIDEQISRAVDFVFRTPSGKRSLGEIVDAAVPQRGPLRAALAKWIDPKQLGAYFNGEPAALAERLSFGESRLTTFDMTDTFDHADKSVPAAIGAEIFHRIRMEMREKAVPALIVVDEAQAILADPSFRAQIKTMLLELRKLGGSVVLMFQTPDAIENLDPQTAALLRSQTATHLFFRDAGAATNLAAYEKWGLKARELAFIRRQDARTNLIDRAMLVRKKESTESVILDVGYERLGMYRHIFASGQSEVTQAIEAQRIAGGDPIWVENYVRQREELAGAPMRRKAGAA